MSKLFKIEVLSGKNKGQEKEFDKDQISIGSSSSDDFVFDFSSGIRPNNVSITFKDNVFYIKNNCFSPLYLNGETCKESELNDQDEFQFGKIGPTLKFICVSVELTDKVEPKATADESQTLEVPLDKRTSDDIESDEHLSKMYEARLVEEKEAEKNYRESFNVLPHLEIRKEEDKQDEIDYPIDVEEEEETEEDTSFLENSTYVYKIGNLEITKKDLSDDLKSNEVKKESIQSYSENLKAEKPKEDLFLDDKPLQDEHFEDESAYTYKEDVILETEETVGTSYKETGYNTGLNDSYFVDATHRKYDSKEPSFWLVLEAFYNQYVDAFLRSLISMAAKKQSRLSTLKYHEMKSIVDNYNNKKKSKEAEGLSHYEKAKFHKQFTSMFVIGSILSFGLALIIAVMPISFCLNLFAPVLFAYVGVNTVCLKKYKYSPKTFYAVFLSLAIIISYNIVVFSHDVISCLFSSCGGSKLYLFMIIVPIILIQMLIATANALNKTANIESF